MDRPYEDGSRKNWFKLKPVFENSMEITGFSYGTGKYAGLISSLEVKDKSRIVRTNMGSGFTEDDIFTFMNLHKQGNLIGTIVDVAYNEITRNASGEYSLRFPRLLKIRYDKKDPDTIETKRSSSSKSKSIGGSFF
jgi:ATP-dependent DNA ligase